MFNININKNFKNTSKNVYKLIAVYLQNYSYLSCDKFYTFFFYSFFFRIMLFDMVPSLLLLGNWKPRYESLCSYTPLIFMYSVLISHVFIKINENLNLMFYELDHFGKHVVSMH